MKKFLAVLTIMMCLFTALQVSADEYTYTELLGPGYAALAINSSGVVSGGSVGYPGFTYNSGTYTTLTGLSQGWAINDSGAVVGAYDGTLYSGGTVTSILPSGWTWGHATGINNSGTAAGWGGNNSNALGGFTYNSGSWDVFGGPTGWTSVNVAGINGSGTVVGSGNKPLGGGNSTRSGFAYNSGTYMEIIPSDFGWAEPHAINKNGDVVGYGITDGQFWGFIYSGGAYAPIGPPGWQWVDVTGLNSNMDIVGYGQRADGEWRGFVYSNGVYTEISPAGANYVQPQGINDQGVIVGWYQSGYYNGNGFIATPSRVPEPATMLLFAFGLMGLAGLRKRFNK